MKKKERPQSGGTQILAPLNYAQVTSAGWYQGADTLLTSDNDVITAADYAWKQLYANISITRRDELMNMGDSQKLQFVASKMKIAERTMRDSLATGIFSSGTDSRSIVGLGSILSTSNTIGGISQSTNSWWQANVDSTTTTLTIAAMQSLFGDCSNGDTAEAPTVIIGDQDMYDRSNECRLAA